MRIVHLFHFIQDYSGLFRIIQDYSRLFTIFHDYSRLFTINARRALAALTPFGIVISKKLKSLLKLLQTVGNKTSHFFNLTITNNSFTIYYNCSINEMELISFMLYTKCLNVLTT